MAILQSFYTPHNIEAGIDEAGRGCLAGPVYAAAVIMPADYYHPQLNDSKKISEKWREILRFEIEKEAISWQVAAIKPKVIDKINILQATYKAMHTAVGLLHVTPQLLLVDGNRFLPYNGIPHVCLIKGDAHFTSIAAASILAKTHRDECMQLLHKQHPMYNWNSNKGYGTASHVQAIYKHGQCVHHRKSFVLKSTHTLFTQS